MAKLALAVIAACALALALVLAGAPTPRHGAATAPAEVGFPAEPASKARAARLEPTVAAVALIRAPRRHDPHALGLGGSDEHFGRPGRRIQEPVRGGGVGGGAGPGRA
jgi:hypothetical protein